MRNRVWMTVGGSVLFLVGVLSGNWIGTTSDVSDLVAESSAGAPSNQTGSAPAVSRASQQSVKAEFYEQLRSALDIADVDNYRRGRILDKLVHELTAEQAREALEYVSRTPGLGSLKERLLGRWASLDGPSAFDYAVAHGKSVSVTPVIWGWYPNDPEEVEARIQSMKAGGDRNSALRAVAQITGESNPARALEIAQSLPPSEGVDVVGEIIKKWAKRDRRTATRKALDLPPLYYNAIVPSLTKEWAESDAGAALEWANEIFETDLRKSTLEAVAAASAAKDPGRTAERLLALARKQSTEEPYYKNPGLAVALKQWAQRDGNAAIAWIKELPEPEGRTELIDQARRELMRTNPAGTIAMILAEPSGSSVHNLVSKLTEAWFYADAKAAIEWGRQSHPTEVQDAAWVALGRAMGQRNPGEILKAAPASLSPEGRQAMVKEVIGYADEARLGEIAAWVLHQPDGEMKNMHAEYLVGQWASVDQKAALAWIKNLPAGPLKEACKRGIPIERIDEFNEGLPVAEQVAMPDLSRLRN